jgi:diguanylate cyclase
VSASRAAIDLSTSQGAAVLGLLEKAKVPPLPAFYRLMYDYVAGVHGLFAGRVDAILAEGDAAGRSVHEQLYAEFVAPYENQGTLERAVASIVGRLQTLDVLVGASMAASRTQSASLRQASSDLASATLDGELLRDWVMRLEDATNQMHRAHSALTRELDAAQAELDATRAEIDRSKADARLDPLTGLVNRGGLDVELSRLIALHRQTGDLACIALDIDHFKSLNDSYGHQPGDEVLRVVSRVLLVTTREHDIVGRPGGDEFIVVLPATGMETARHVAERIRTGIHDSDLRGVLGPQVLGGVSASLGIAQVRPGDSISTLVGRADACLYAAKNNGRNRVVCEGERDAPG